MERSSSGWFKKWRRRKAREGRGAGGEGDHQHKVVVDGSEIWELVEDGEAFGMLVDTTFRQLDADGDGRISAEELLAVLASLGDDRCSVEDCRRMIGGVDVDGDGFVCFNEFARMMTQGV